jgi:hypothetical protein
MNGKAESQRGDIADNQAMAPNTRLERRLKPGALLSARFGLVFKFILMDNARSTDSARMNSF